MRLTEKQASKLYDQAVFLKKTVKRLENEKKRWAMDIVQALFTKIEHHHQCRICEAAAYPHKRDIKHKEGCVVKEAMDYLKLVNKKEKGITNE